MNNQFTLLRWAAILEGSSLIALVLFAVPLKYMASIPTAVQIIGPIHGVLFLLFVAVLLFHFLKGDVNFIKTLIGLVASFIPFGTFIFKAKCLTET